MLLLLLACSPQLIDTGGVTAPLTPLEPGLHELSFDQEIDGEVVARRVLLHVPESVGTGEPLPLVFGFHGNGGDADMWPDWFSRQIEAGEAIGVYPDGHMASWNLGWEASTADDLAFVDMIFDELGRYAELDLDRASALGISNGAGMAHRLAIHRDHFDGIVTGLTSLIEGKLPEEDTAPVSVLQFHGTADEVCPYEGGPASMGHVFLSAEESAQTWAAHNDCDVVPTTTVDHNHTRFDWGGCSADRQVGHIRMEDVGHELPMDIFGDTQALIWEFLMESFD